MEFFFFPRALVKTISSLALDEFLFEAFNWSKRNSICKVLKIFYYF